MNPTSSPVSHEGVPMLDESGPRMSMEDMKQIARRQQGQDWVFHQLTRFFSWAVLFALVGILVSLILNAMPAFAKFGIEFVWRVEWDIINQEFGAAIAIFGTVVSAGIALLIAVPLSFGIALFLTETCPVVLRRPLGTAIELLAAVPSIIYGMFGLFLFAPGTSIASTLANEFGEADDFHLSALFALGLLLFLITFVVLAAAKMMILRAEKSKGSKT